MGEKRSSFTLDNFKKNVLMDTISVHLRCVCLYLYMNICTLYMNMHLNVVMLHLVVFIESLWTILMFCALWISALILTLATYLIKPLLILIIIIFFFLSVFVFQEVPFSLHSSLGPAQHTFRLSPEKHPLCLLHNLAGRRVKINAFSPLSLKASQLPQICTFPSFHSCGCLLGYHLGSTGWSVVG